MTKPALKEPKATEDQDCWEQLLYEGGKPRTLTVTDNTRGIRTTVALSSTCSIEEEREWAWAEIRRLIKAHDKNKLLKQKGLVDG